MSFVKNSDQCEIYSYLAFTCMDLYIKTRITENGLEDGDTFFVASWFVLKILQPKPLNVCIKPPIKNNRT